MERTSPLSKLCTNGSILTRFFTLFGLLLCSQGVWSIAVSPTTSTDGSYIVNWSTPVGSYTYPETWCDPYLGCFTNYIPYSYSLQENNGSGWVTISTSQGATSKSFSGKPTGTYQYQIYFSGINGQFYYAPPAVTEGPVSVTVTTPLPPPVPGTPTGPSTDDDGTYTISWGAVSGATSYKLEEKLDSGSWTLIHNAAGTSKNRTGLGAGAWSYRVQACNTAGCSGWSGTKSVTVFPYVIDTYLDNDGDGYANLDETLNGSNPNDALSVPANNAGITPGQLSVDQTGGASYSIPIVVPPGTAGMQPTLSLNYSSRGGSGLMGPGWALGGSSAITLCPATVSQDGFIDGIDFDANDKYCLNGQRLIAISGAYGGVGAEYRTEIDSFAKIISYGSQSGDPQYFLVWTKSGQIMEFGNTTDSRIEAQGKTEILTWAINRIKDTVGNYIDFTYIENNPTGEFLPNIIQYGGNSNAGTSWYNQISFVYGPHPGTSTAYVGGSKMSSTNRLAQIVVRADGAISRDYYINYESTTPAHRSRVTDIQECAGDGTCFPATLFDYTSVSHTWTGYTALNNFNPPGYNNTDSYPLINGDWNGDGRLDIARINNAGLTFYVSTGTGWSGFGSISGIGPSGGYSSGSVYPLITGDWNGDGLTDIGRVWNNGIKFYTASSTGAWSVYGGLSTFGAAQGYGNANSYPLITGDWNGDGRTDVGRVHNNGVYFYTSTGSGWLAMTGLGAFGAAQGYSSNSSYPIITGDWNGDGQTDIGRVHNNGVYFYTSTGINWTAITGLSAFGAAQGYANGDSYPVLTGDWNGDGLTDMARVKNTGAGFYLSTGAGWVAYTDLNGIGPSGGYSSASNYPIFTGDWDGDGLTDIGRVHNYGVNFYTSTGNGWSSIAGLGTFGGAQGYNNGSSYPLVVGDWNGDGITDMGRVDDVSFKFYTHSSSVAHQLISVTNGLDVTTYLSYKPLTDSSVYTKGSGSIYPVLDLKSPMYVVRQVTHPDGIGGTRSTTYDYSAARSRLDGRGFLGFRTMSATDSGTGIKTTTTYNQTFPTAGMVDSTITQLANGTTTRNVTSTNITSTTSATNVYFPHATAVVNSDYELDSSLIATVTTSNNSFDSYGNPTSITATTTDNVETFITTTVNTYYYDASFINNWFINRLKRTSVTQSTPAGSGTRVSSFTYRISDGLLATEVIEPDNSNLKLTTTYGYDVFGNKTSTSVSGLGITTRTTTTAFNTRGQFATSSTNALLQSETYTWDPKHGNLLTRADPNNLTTTFRYDSFGRQYQEIQPDDTKTTIGRFWCNSSCPANGELKTTKVTDGAAPTMTYADNLGREIRNQTIGMDGRVINIDTVYNALGQKDFTSRPYFESDTPLWHDINYDILGRVTTQTNPDGGFTTNSYNGLETTVTNDLQQTTTRINNARGELVVVIDDANHETDYYYDSFGNLEQVTVDSAGQAISTYNTYDIRGRKLSMDDPDMGHWAYNYNVLGELVSQTDAKSQTVSMQYDLLGRLISRTEAEGATQWTYDTSPLKGKGKLHYATLTNSSNVVLQKITHGYDTLGRPLTKTTQIDENLNGSFSAAETYTTSQDYDVFGRLYTLTYPESYHYNPATNGALGFTVRHEYTDAGYMDRVLNHTTGQVYWQAETQNAEGQLTEFGYGNGISNYRSYDPNTGAISTIRASSATAGAGVYDIQDYRYTFDTIGNLKRRYNYREGIGEEFFYTEGASNQNHLNRLTKSNFHDGITYSNDISAGNLTASVIYSYDAVGNIVSKSDVSASNYLYGSLNVTGMAGDAGPHAVVNLGGKTYTYDDNGNMLSGWNFEAGANRSLTWTSYNKPGRITQGSTTLDFYYGIDRARYKQVNSNGKTTIYVDGLYEKETAAGFTTHVHYINAGGAAIAIYKSTNSGIQQTRYQHHDHIGSVTELTGGDLSDPASYGLLLQKLSFDPHGQRRILDSADPLQSLTFLETARGFTNHEMLDDVDIIHMNGRIYDPTLGRFLSADPTVQYPANPQSHNRYSYVNNNPLSYVDPDGFGFFDVVKDYYVGTFICGPGCGVLNATTGVINTALQNPIVGTLVRIGSCATGNIGICAAGAATVTAANGGNLGDIVKSAAIAGRTAYAMGWVGDTFTGPIENALAHGVVGGTASVAGGGDFLSGFASGSFGALASNNLQTGDFRFDLAVASIAGGIGDVLGGGKFLNGAVTGAFGYLYNYCRHAECTSFGEQFAYDWMPGYKGGTCISNGFSGCSVWEMVDGVSVGIGAAGTVLNKVSAFLKGTSLAARGGTTVIGKLDDLKNLRPGERTLLDRLPNQGSPQANWHQNSGVLRQEMGRGLPIRDATVDAAGRQINNTGFLRAERNLLECHGWCYNPSSTMWTPPVGP